MLVVGAEARGAEDDGGSAPAPALRRFVPSSRRRGRLALAQRSAGPRPRPVGPSPEPALSPFDAPWRWPGRGTRPVAPVWPDRVSVGGSGLLLVLLVALGDRSRSTASLRLPMLMVAYSFGGLHGADILREERGAGTRRNRSVQDIGLDRQAADQVQSLVRPVDDRGRSQARLRWPVGLARPAPMPPNTAAGTRRLGVAPARALRRSSSPARSGCRPDRPPPVRPRLLPPLLQSSEARHC